jgi:hypothetical protein
MIHPAAAAAERERDDHFLDVNGDIRETRPRGERGAAGRHPALLPQEGGARRRCGDGRRRPAERPHPRRLDGGQRQGPTAGQIRQGDIGILNYALTLEYLEAAFYNEATAKKKRQDAVPQWAAEQAFLKQTTAVALENAVVGAYSGQALNISSPAYVAAALSIWSIEAPHASVAGLLLKPTPANISPNGAFDKPKTAAQVLKAVAATGFLK